MQQLTVMTCNSNPVHQAWPIGQSHFTARLYPKPFCDWLTAIQKAWRVGAPPGLVLQVVSLSSFLALVAPSSSSLSSSFFCLIDDTSSTLPSLSLSLPNHFHSPIFLWRNWWKAFWFLVFGSRMFHFDTDAEGEGGKERQLAGGKGGSRNQWSVVLLPCGWITVQIFLLLFVGFCVMVGGWGGCVW